MEDTHKFNFNRMIGSSVRIGTATKKIIAPYRAAKVLFVNVPFLFFF